MSYSRQEFVTTYIVLEEKIRFKQIRLQKALEELIQTREKYYKGMIENQNEKLNREGLAENAVLNVSVLEAKDLKPFDFTGKCDPFVQLALDDKKEKSTYKEDTIEPVWNEDFVLSVRSKQSILRVEILDKDIKNGSNEERVVCVPLVSLLNQQKMDNWFPIENENTYEEKGSIRLKLQLIWSRYQYFQENLNKIDEKIKKIKRDMEELNKYLELFEKPFGILLYIEIDEGVSQIMWGDTEEIMNQNNGRRSLAATHHPNQARDLAKTVSNVLRGTFSKFN